MQEDFIRGVRELHKSTRPPVDYIKDFERRAEEHPKACAEEALREVMAGTTMLLRVFREAFHEDFEEAFNRVFYLTAERQCSLREDAALPDNPVLQEFFLLWLYWLHFYRITLNFFERCLATPGGPHEGHAKSICECFIRHEQASWSAYLIVADEVAKRFPKRIDVHRALVEQFAAFFVVHISLHTNLRLRHAIDELREPDESRFERLIKEAYGEVWAVWREKRTEWAGEYVRQDHLMQMRTEIVRRLEQRALPTQENELADFGESEKAANRKRAVKLADEAGLPPRERQVFLFLAKNPNATSAEVGQRFGIAPSTARTIRSNLKKALNF